jgi:hypothetical protein
MQGRFRQMYRPLQNQFHQAQDLLQQLLETHEGLQQRPLWNRMLETQTLPALRLLHIPEAGPLRWWNDSLRMQDYSLDRY